MAPQKPGSRIVILQNVLLNPATKMKVNKVSSGGFQAMTENRKTNFPRYIISTAGLATVLRPGKSLLKDKENMSFTYTQPFDNNKKVGDEVINDVVAMGGINLAAETQRILSSTEMIGTQTRSCKEEYLVPTSVMQSRIKTIVAKHGLVEPSLEVASLLSHALQERLKNLIEKLSVNAQRRIDHDLIIKTDNRYVPTQDVKGQLKFLEELEWVEKKRRVDSERKMLLRAAKSHLKNKNPGQAKLMIAKAKKMKRAQMEEMRLRETNLAALQAIGPRKKPRLDGPAGTGDSISTSFLHPGSGFTGRSQVALRTPLKRINQRDMLFLLEQEHDTAHSLFLYKAYLK